MDLVYKELKHFKEVHKVEYNYFWADTFLGMSNKEFDEFVEMYQDIKLPFWMQTRPETVTDYNLSKLKAVLSLFLIDGLLDMTRGRMKDFVIITQNSS